MVEPTEMEAVTDNPTLLTQQMRQVADSITQSITVATSANYRMSSAGGEVIVDTDGRPRVTGVHIAPRTMRLDSTTLGELIAGALNAALHNARQAGQSALIEGLDPVVRTAFVAHLAQTRDALIEADDSDSDPEQEAR